MFIRQNFMLSDGLRNGLQLFGCKPFYAIAAIK